MIGSQVGSYKIIRELGEGGMGTVYLAEHAMMGKEAAVKVLQPQFCAVPEIVERFFNEAKAASKIKHPGIVDVYDFGQTESQGAYIIMELLDGEELTELLERENSLPESQVAYLGEQMAMALQAAHDQGIIHRDMKPDNVFLEPDSAAKGGVRPKILDFGIAKLTQDNDTGLKTQTGAMMGTPVFMSPEQCKGAGGVDHRSDIYTLGCILYNMLAGRPPFVRPGAGALVVAHISEEPETVRTFAPDISLSMESLVMSCLEKEPAARPQTMSDLADSLAVLYAGEGASHRLGTSGLPRPMTAPPNEEEEKVSPSHAGIPKTNLSNAPAPAAAVPNHTTLGGSASIVSLTDEGSTGSWKWLAAAGGALVAGALFFVLSRDSETSATQSSATPSTTALSAKSSDSKTSAAASAQTLKKTKVEITLETEPAGAAVYRAADMVKLGTTPYADQFLRGKGEMEFVLKLAGHEPKTISLSLNSDHSEKIELAALESSSQTSQTPVVSKSGKTKPARKDKTKKSAPKEGKTESESKTAGSPEKKPEKIPEKIPEKKPKKEEEKPKKPKDNWGELAP